jgi:hypothetical protein
MSILLIDGVKYEEWTPKTEDDFEHLVKEHAKDIFGEQSEYFEIKHKLKSKAGKGSIPDGFAIVFGVKPRWHIVEIELSSHAYEHIAGQLSKFVSGITNATTQREIVDVIYNDIYSDEFRKLRVRKAIGTTDTHKFLADLISGPAMLTIIIEKHTEEVDEALSMLAYPPQNKEVIEFQTFTRASVGLNVHAHLFQPLHKSPEGQKGQRGYGTKGEEGKPKAKKVGFRELEKAGLAKDGQILCFYHTRLFENEQARIVTSSNELEYKADGNLYSASELAKKLLIKHGFKRDGHGVAGPRYWKTENGKLLDELNEEVRSRRGDRK